MFVIPVSVNALEYNLFVILADDNIGRMKEYDPAQFDARGLSPEFKDKRIRHIIVGYATAADMDRVIQLGNEGKIGEALEVLVRGRRFRPEAGDHDGPPLSVIIKPGEKKH